MEASFFWCHETPSPDPSLKMLELGFMEGGFPGGFVEPFFPTRFLCFCKYNLYKVRNKKLFGESKIILLHHRVKLASFFVSIERNHSANMKGINFNAGS